MPDEEQRRKKERHWTGEAPSGDWSDEDNWGGSTPPTEEHHVVVYRASLVHGRDPYTPGVDTTIRALTLDMSRSKQSRGPVVDNGSDQDGLGGKGLTIEEELHWTHGYIEATLKLGSRRTRVLIDTPAMIRIPPALEGLSLPDLELQALEDVPPKLLGEPLDVPGPCEVRKAHLRMIQNGMVTLRGPSKFVGPSRFSGGMRETCGLRVDGNCTVESGVVYVDDVSLIVTGTVTIKKGASLVLTAATAPHLLTGSAQVNGDGTLVVAGRLLVARGATINSATRVVLDGGVIEDRRAWELAARVLGPARAVRLAVSGPLEWRGGTLESDVVIEKTGSLSASGPAVRSQASGTLINRGLVELKNTVLSATSGSVVNDGHLNFLGDVAIISPGAFRLENRRVMSVNGGTAKLDHFPFVNKGRLSIGDLKVEAVLQLDHVGKSLFTQQGQRAVVSIAPGSILRSTPILTVAEGTLTGGTAVPGSSAPPGAGAAARVEATVVLNCKVIPGSPVVPGWLLIEGACELGKDHQLVLRDHAPAGGATARLEVTGQCKIVGGTALLQLAGIPPADYLSDVTFSADKIKGGFLEVKVVRLGALTLRLALSGSEVRMRIERGPGVAVDLLRAASYQGQVLPNEPGFGGTPGECATGVQFVFQRALRPLGLTAMWKQGLKVKGNNIPPGTAIASFRDGTYQDDHAAILVREKNEGLEVLEQFTGRPWQTRVLRFDHVATERLPAESNNGGFFYVIEPASG